MIAIQFKLADSNIVGAFAESRKATISIVISVCLSVCPLISLHGTTLGGSQSKDSHESS